MATQALVIGSGAGGAVTALTLAERGIDVLVIEEGMRHAKSEYGQPASVAMPKLYRQGGMTPVMGRVPIGYVEGRCLGGSTEINSGFWHRAPREILMRWKAQFELANASEAELQPYYEWAERKLGVTPFQRLWPPATEAFARGIKAMDWSYNEPPRAAPNCRNSNLCPVGCPTGAKQGMSVRMWPEAERLGVKVLTGCRAKLLLKHRGRVTGVVAALEVGGGKTELIRLNADLTFVCAGPTETPSLLLRSGIRYHVGDSLRIHPYLKVAARFPEVIDAEKSVLPLLQVKQFWPEISFGGSYFSKGQLAMTLSENWPDVGSRMTEYRHMALFYVGVKGTGKGWVRPSSFGREGTLINYQLSEEDRRGLSKGLARLATLLLAGGATAVMPSVQGLPVIDSEDKAVRWLDELLPASSMSLTSVHAFSSVPIGERRDRCAADSFGKIYGFENLYINDASMLPDSPGVNPQGSVMALARRNALAVGA